MKVVIMGLTLGAALVGCGSSSESVAVQGPFQPAVAQIQPVAGASQFAGNWSGALDKTDSVSLHIIQDGNELSGDGIFFDDDNPVTVTVEGSVSGNSFELGLYPEAPGATLDLLVQGELNGSQAECYLSSEGQDDFRPLTLQRPEGTSLRLSDGTGGALPETFVATFQASPDLPAGAVVRLTLDDTEEGVPRPFFGHWETPGGQTLGPFYLKGVPVSRGYLNAAAVPDRPGWFHFLLFSDPDTPGGCLGKLLVRLLGGNRPGVIAPSSFLNIGKDLNLLRGGYEARRTIFYGGSITPL